MLNDRELFKFGFLMRCAEEGLTSEQTQERVGVGIDKNANIWSALQTVGVAGPVMAGGLGLAGGYGLGKMMERDVNPDEIRQEELAAMYQFQADQARRRAQAKRLRDAHRERIRTQQII